MADVRCAAACQARGRQGPRDHVNLAWWHDLVGEAVEEEHREAAAANGLGDVEVVPDQARGHDMPRAIEGTELKAASRTRPAGAL